VIEQWFADRRVIGLARPVPYLVFIFKIYEKSPRLLIKGASISKKICFKIEKNETNLESKTKFLLNKA
jgi:hypothetical protein